MNNSSHPLYTVFLKVLEDWAMMLVDQTSEGTKIFETDEPFYRVHVEMHGTFNGTISIVAQKDFMRALTANLLGADGANQDSDEQFEDAFKEMGNVLAGNFLTEAYGADVAFDVLHPSVDNVTAEQVEKLAQAPQSYFFIADDTPVCATFTIEK